MLVRPGLSRRGPSSVVGGIVRGENACLVPALAQVAVVVLLIPFVLIAGQRQQVTERCRCTYDSEKI